MFGGLDGRYSGVQPSRSLSVGRAPSRRRPRADSAQLRAKRQRAPRRPAAAVTTRLIALVMLPVTAMCVLAGSVVVSHRSAAAQAVDIEQGVVGLGPLLAVRDAFHTLQSAGAFDVRFQEFGITREVATEFIGFDWATQIAPARAEAFAAIAALGESSPVNATEFASLNAATDGSLISPAAALAELTVKMRRLFPGAPRLRMVGRHV